MPRGRCALCVTDPVRRAGFGGATGGARRSFGRHRKRRRGGGYARASGTKGVDLEKLGSVDLSAANQVYSELRALKVELSFAIGGIKNHEIYFEHLGGGGGAPDGLIGRLIERDFGSVEDWARDLKASGMAGRGWAWTAYDWDESRLLN